MQRSKIDLWVGLFVLIGAAALLFLALRSANLLTLNFKPTYAVTANFQNIGSLKPGAPVKSAGVVVGRVASIGFDDYAYSVAVQSDGRIVIAGATFATNGIEPGADEKNLVAGDRITSTQSAVVLENLIGQFLYNKAADGASAAPDAGK